MASNFLELCVQFCEVCPPRQLTQKVSWNNFWRNIFLKLVSTQFYSMKNSPKTLPAANLVRPWDTSGPKLLDTPGHETLPALDISGREPWDKSGPEKSGPKTSQDKSGLTFIYRAGLVSGPDLSKNFGAGSVQKLQGKKCLAAGSVQKFRAGSVSRPNLVRGRKCLGAWKIEITSYVRNKSIKIRILNQKWFDPIVLWLSSCYLLI